MFATNANKQRSSNMKAIIFSFLLLDLIMLIFNPTVVAFSLNRTSRASVVMRSNTSITQSSFVSRKSIHRRSRVNASSPFPHKRNISHSNVHRFSMLRNVDLPEALIFYGLDTIIHKGSSSSEPTVRPGVLRLLDEAKDINIPTFILSEHLTMSELSKAIESVEPSFRKLCDANLIHYRSSLEEFVVNRYSNEGNEGREDDEICQDEYALDRFVGGGIGHAPCPAALYDAVNTVEIVPKGFGGSSGFGVKNWEAERPPLPQHCVVFICSESDRNNRPSEDGSKSLSRDRSIASHYAGMRVMYIEDEGLPCTAEDVADGIVASLGTEDDWEMVTLDDVSTPGSFWLNMMQPKDEEGFAVNTAAIIKEFVTQRKGEEEETSHSYTDFDNQNSELDEDELARILADIDPL